MSKTKYIKTPAICGNLFNIQLATQPSIKAPINTIAILLTNCIFSRENNGNSRIPLDKRAKREYNNFNQSN